MIYSFNGDINTAEFRAGFTSALVFIQDQITNSYPCCKYSKKQIENLISVVIKHRFDLIDKRKELYFNATKKEFVCK